jgi:uncharacterized repeat protein (TIGR03847 family)
MFQPVERITVGTVGEPGSRVFYLQASTAAELITVKLEKQHVAAMVEHLTKVLADLPSVDEPLGNMELLEPVEQRWIVGAMALTPYDDDRDAVNLLVEEAVAEDEVGASIGFQVSRVQLAALVARGNELLEEGRPPCPLCGGPMDPEGHTCPRSNGHARAR